MASSWDPPHLYGNVGPKGEKKKKNGITREGSWDVIFFETIVVFE